MQKAGINILTIEAKRITPGKTPKQIQNKLTKTLFLKKLCPTWSISAPYIKKSQSNFPRNPYRNFCVRNMFSLFDSLLANKGAFQNNQKIEKVRFLRFYKRFINYFYRIDLTRMQSSMDEKNKRENMFLTDKLARTAFCVGRLFYPIIFSRCIFLPKTIF